MHASDFINASYIVSSIYANDQISNKKFEPTKVDILCNKEYRTLTCLPQYAENPKQPAYIASQGPLQNCVGDFWQMVWEQGISEIIMLSLNDGVDVSLVVVVISALSSSSYLTR